MYINEVYAYELHYFQHNYTVCKIITQIDFFSSNERDNERSLNKTKYTRKEKSKFYFFTILLYL